MESLDATNIKHILYYKKSDYSDKSHIIDDDIDDDIGTFHILINASYRGNFTLSKEARDLYILKKRVKDPKFKYNEKQIIRDDPILIETCRELGNKIIPSWFEIESSMANDGYEIKNSIKETPYNDLKIVEMENKYRDVYHIRTEYGCEYIIIDMSEYLIKIFHKKIDKILDDDNLSNEDKITKIREINTKEKKI